MDARVEKLHDDCNNLYDAVNLLGTMTNLDVWQMFAALQEDGYESMRDSLTGLNLLKVTVEREHNRLTNTFRELSKECPQDCVGLKMYLDQINLRLAQVTIDINKLVPLFKEMPMREDQMLCMPIYI